MEPITLAGTAISILGPYVGKGTEEFIKAAGKDAYEKTKNLLASLRSRWAGNQEAANTLSNFEKKPDRYGSVLTSVLEEELSKDPAFLADLSHQVSEIGPYIEIIQKMKKGEDVTGVQADEIMKGTVKVNQDIDEGRNVKGGVFKRIG